MDQPESKDNPPQEAMDALIGLCRSGQLTEAEVKVKRLLRDFPNDLQLNDMFAGILAGQGRHQEAIPAYQKTIQIKPDHWQAYFALGNIFLHQGVPKDAIATYGKVVEIIPEFAPAQSNLGTALLGVGRVEDSIEYFTRALELDPKLADALVNLGIALRNLGRTEEAVESFEKALELEPGAAETHNNLGAAMEELGRLDEAVNNYATAIEINPAYGEAHCNLANARAASGQHQDAVESYQRAIEVKPGFAEAHNSLGVSLKEMGQLEDAETSFRKAVEIDPGFAAAHNNLATVLRRLGALEESATSARNALNHDPNSAEAFYNLGAAQQLEGQREAAVDSYQSALEIRPDFGDAHSNVGHALQDLGRFAEAITHFEVLETRIACARALECHFALGNVDEYNARLKALCKSDPTNIWAAGIATFAAQQWGAENPYMFCKEPLDFISINNVKLDLNPFESFATKLLEEIEHVHTIWEPPENTTVNGYHTAGNLFQLGTPTIVALQNIISQNIATYRSNYAGRPDAFIAQWPAHSSLTGWHIKLLKDGYQESHIHPSGWLSGVIYLKMPENLDQEQGAITFTLHGRDYPILKEDIPSFRHVPKAGDLVLFPSSLFHYTSPFHSDGERLCVAFDLCPSHGVAN